MSEAIDHETLHHLVDRLSPVQARHLRLIIGQDRELAPIAQSIDSSTDQAKHAVPDDLLSLIGRVDSGQTDRSENTDTYIRERLARRRQQRA
jgi:hypothetical protein